MDILTENYRETPVERIPPQELRAILAERMGWEWWLFAGGKRLLPKGAERYLAIRKADPRDQDHIHALRDVPKLVKDPEAALSVLMWWSHNGQDDRSVTLSYSSGGDWWSTSLVSDRADVEEDGPSMMLSLCRAIEAACRQEEDDD